MQIISRRNSYIGRRDNGYAVSRARRIELDTMWSILLLFRNQQLLGLALCQVQKVAGQLAHPNHCSQLSQGVRDADDKIH